MADVWLAIARIDGEIKGAMTYTITENKGEMTVKNFLYTDIHGRYLLLEWFARHIDHVSTIAVNLPSFEHPETWWPDLELQLEGTNPPLSRIVDLERMSGLAAGKGRFTAQINDEYCPWNEGTFVFESVDGELRISRSSGNADCTLSIQGVSGLFYGTHEPETFALRGWGNPSPEQQATLHTMFPPLQPFMYEKF